MIRFFRLINGSVEPLRQYQLNDYALNELVRKPFPFKHHLRHFYASMDVQSESSGSPLSGHHDDNGAPIRRVSSSQPVIPRASYRHDER